MPRTKSQSQQMDDGNRAAIYARVSAKSQAEDDKTSISEQIVEMEAYCEDKGSASPPGTRKLGTAGPKSARSFSACWPTLDWDDSTPSSAGSRTD